MNKEDRLKRDQAIHWMLSQRHAVKDIAAFLGMSKTTVYNIAREAPPRHPNPTASKVDWEKIDWVQHDSKIAFEQGVTRQHISHQRKALGIPTATKLIEQQQVDKLKQLAESQGGSLEHIPVEIVMKAMNIPTVYKVTEIAKKAGVKLKRGRADRPPYHLVNWELPNIDIERIWKMSRNSPANYRCSKRLQAPRWTPAATATQQDPEYIQAIQQETQKAQDRKALINKAERELNET